VLKFLSVGISLLVRPARPGFGAAAYAERMTRPRRSVGAIRLAGDESESPLLTLARLDLVCHLWIEARHQRALSTSAMHAARAVGAASAFA
jgi:hypothetical protein